MSTLQASRQKARDAKAMLNEMAHSQCAQSHGSPKSVQPVTSPKSIQHSPKHGQKQQRQVDPPSSGMYQRMLATTPPPAPKPSADELKKIAQTRQQDMLLRAQRAEEARPAEPPAAEKLEKDALVARVKELEASLAASRLESKHGSSQLNECQKQLVIETAEARNAKRRSEEDRKVASHVSDVERANARMAGEIKQLQNKLDKETKISKRVIDAEADVKKIANTARNWEALLETERAESKRLRVVIQNLEKRVEKLQLGK